MCRGGFQFSGDLTYYGGAGTGGSCTSGYVPPGYTTVAMNNVQYSNGRVCGMCVNACYTDNSGERCFNAIVDNRCPVRPPPYAPLTCRCPSGGRTLPLGGSHAAHLCARAHGRCRASGIVHCSRPHNAGAGRSTGCRERQSHGEV